MMEGPPKHRIGLLKSVKYAHFISSFRPDGPSQLPGTPFLPQHLKSHLKERQLDLSTTEKHAETTAERGTPFSHANYSLWSVQKV